MIRQFAKKAAGAGLHGCRVAIAGGDRDALEVFATLSQDPETQVVCIWDPDGSALVHRLEDLGFEFSDAKRPRVFRDFSELEEVEGLTLFVVSSDQPQLRDQLSFFREKGIKIISGRSAQILWRLRLDEGASREETLAQVKDLLERMDLLEAEDEFLELLLQLGLLLTASTAAALYLVRAKQNEPLLMHATDRSFLFNGSSGIRRFPGGRALWFPVLEAARMKQPVFSPEPESDFERASAGPGGEGFAMAFPIPVGEHFTGIIELVRDTTGRAYAKSEAEACAAWSTVASASIERYRKMCESRTASAAETLRAEIRAILGSQVSLQEKLGQGADQIRAALGDCHVHFYLREQSCGDLILQASTHQASQMIGNLKIRAGDGFVGEVANTRQQVFIKGCVPHSRSGKEQALLCVPLNTSEGLYGVLSIEQFPVGMGSEKMIDLIDEIAGDYALAVSEDLRHHRMSQKLLRLSVVHEEGLELFSIKDRERLAMTLTASAAMLVDAEAVILRLLNRKQRRLLVGSTYGLHKNEMDTRLVDLDIRIAAKIFQGIKARLIPDLRKYDPSLPPKFPYRYGACVPLVHEGTALGTLSVYNKLAYQSFGCTGFDSDDLEILEKFLHYAGRALINVQEAQARSTLITIDELTGLRNERYLMLRLPEEMRRAERYKRSLSLMIFEARSEAEVQPEEGSRAWKEFVKQVAEVLQEQFRNVDILVRLRSAQFAILMPDTGEHVTDAADRLARGLAILPLKLLVGYGSFPSDVKTVQELIQKASRLSEMPKNP